MAVVLLCPKSINQFNHSICNYNVICVLRTSQWRKAVSRILDREGLFFRGKISKIAEKCIKNLFIYPFVTFLRLEQAFQRGGGFKPLTPAGYDLAVGVCRIK